MNNDAILIKQMHDRNQIDGAIIWKKFSLCALVLDS